MRTNIEIDDRLMKQTIRAAGARTKRAAVETAMRAFVQLKDQEKALRELRGIGKWEGDLEQSRLNRFADRKW
jgi:Arc/MetJ family transcription regulator